jgi:hypothetical protein
LTVAQLEAEEVININDENKAFESALWTLK